MVFIMTMIVRILLNLDVLLAQLHNPSSVNTIKIPSDRSFDHVYNQSSSCFIILIRLAYKNIFGSQML